MVACHDQVRKGGLEGGSVKYLIVAEAYRDLEQASGRLVLIERMAELVTQTPAELLPTVCYLGQGQIAPEFAGIDLGLAEKMAIRALAAATGTETAQVATYVRETGDLGQAAEQLLADIAAGRAASLEVVTVVRTLRQIAAAEGQGSQGFPPRPSPGTAPRGRDAAVGSTRRSDSARCAGPARGEPVHCADRPGRTSRG